jgi:hypothetical protein
MADISTIQDFYRVARARDFNRKNQLRILNIESGNGFSTSFTPDDLVYIRTGNIPTRNVQTSVAAFLGLDFNIPGNVKYSGSDAYTVTFFADQKLDLYSKFLNWTREIFDDVDSTGNYFTPKQSASITLAIVDTKLVPVKLFKLIGVVCKNVGQLSYTMDDAGTLQTFDTTFSYHYFEESTPNT